MRSTAVLTIVPSYLLEHCFVSASCQVRNLADLHFRSFLAILFTCGDVTNTVLGGDSKRGMELS